MSKLSEHIKAYALHRVPPPMNSTHMTMEIDDAIEAVPFRDSRCYRIGVTLSAHVVAEVSNFDQQVDQARRALLDRVFGEFRRPLMMARLACANRDFEEADRLLQQIEKDMLS